MSESVHVCVKERERVRNRERVCAGVYLRMRESEKGVNERDIQKFRGVKYNM